MKNRHGFRWYVVMVDDVRRLTRITTWSRDEVRAHVHADRGNENARQHGWDEIHWEIVWADSAADAKRIAGKTLPVVEMEASS